MRPLLSFGQTIDSVAMSNSFADINDYLVVSAASSSFINIPLVLSTVFVTQGTVLTGSTTLVVTSAMGIYTGNTVTVAGAGAAGVPLVTTVTVNGNTLTLGTPASTTVSSAAVTLMINPKAVLITPTGDIYVSTSTTTPSAPASTVTSGTGTGAGLVYIPGTVGRLFGINSGITAIGCYSTPGANVSFEWYSFTQ